MRNKLYVVYVVVFSLLCVVGVRYVNIRAAQFDAQIRAQAAGLEQSPAPAAPVDRALSETAKMNSEADAILKGGPAPSEATIEPDPAPTPVPVIGFAPSCSDQAGVLYSCLPPGGTYHLPYGTVTKLPRRR